MASDLTPSEVERSRIKVRRRMEEERANRAEAERDALADRLRRGVEVVRDLLREWDRASARCSCPNGPTEKDAAEQFDALKRARALAASEGEREGGG